jgi:hypothetical protein
VVFPTPIGPSMAMYFGSGASCKAGSMRVLFPFCKD